MNRFVLIIIYSSFLTGLFSCNQRLMILKSEFLRSGFDLQGHRGCRGLMPENTIPAFQKAIDLNVNTLELDIIISGDKKVVVSHEPWINRDICIIPGGKKKSGNVKKNYNMFDMSYSDIKSFDCGSKYYSKFPDQVKLKAKKPLLDEVVKFAEEYCKQSDKDPIFYNIELKYKTKGEGVFHPARDEFLDLFYEVIVENSVEDRVTLQCFDFEVLNIAKEKYPKLKLVALVDNWKSASKNIKKLGFKPFAYSPNYIKLSSSDIDFLKKDNIKIIPWTVNKEKHIEKMILLGVDGIISDYPDRVNEVLRQLPKKI